MSNLISIDLITSFNDSTPIKLIQRLKPDFLIKGGDWLEDIVGSSFVKKLVERFFNPFKTDISTTKIINKIILSTTSFSISNIPKKIKSSIIEKSGLNCSFIMYASHLLI